MNMRVVAITLVVALVVSGLIAGVFAGSIERALTIPTVRGAGTTGQQQTTAMKPKPAATATAAMNGANGANGNTGANTNMGQPAMMLAQDLFQRNDQPLWGTATDGRQWGGDANTQQAFSVTGKSGQIANMQGPLNALLGPNTQNVDVLVNGSVSHYAGAAVNLGVTLRWTSNMSWYKALIDAGHLSILKDTGGAPVQLGTVVFHPQDGLVHNLRFRAVGAMLFARAWPDGSPEPARWMLTLNYTSLTSGQVGVRVLMQADTIIKIHAFSAADANSPI